MLWTLTSNLCIFVPHSNHLKCPFNPGLLCKLVIWQELVTYNLPGETRMVEPTTRVILIATFPIPAPHGHVELPSRQLTHHCFHSLMHLSSSSDWAPWEEGRCLFVFLLLDTKSVCIASKFSVCWMNCSFKRRSSIFWAFIFLSFIKPGMDLLTKIIKAIWMQEAKFGRKFLHQLFPVAAHTVGDQSLTVAVLALTAQSSWGLGTRLSYLPLPHPTVPSFLGFHSLLFCFQTS